MRLANPTIAAAAVFAFLCANAHAAEAQHALAPQQISYAAQDLSFPLGYVITWNPASHTAHVAETFGVEDGTYTDDGTTRIITLDHPIVTTDYKLDCNGNAVTMRDDTQQLAFRTSSGEADRGTTHVVPIGITTDIGGCTPGLVTAYGAPTDAGFTLNRLDMRLRAPMDDLRPGTKLVGMSEVALDQPGDGNILAADVVTFGEDEVYFASSGHAFNFKRTDDGWIVVEFGAFQRGYTRLTRDTHSGEEIWLASEWNNGAPGLMDMSEMVMARHDAGFGGVKKASHVWVSGIFLNSAYGAIFDFYRDGTGQKNSTTTDGSPPTLSPFTWSGSGAQLLSKFPNGDGTYSLRTWTPVADYGRNHFVIESESAYDASGNLQSVVIPPRVNFLIDDGKSVEPPPTATTTTTASPSPSAVAPLTHRLHHGPGRATKTTPLPPPTGGAKGAPRTP